LPGPKTAEEIHEAAAALIELPNSGLPDKERLRLLAAIQKAKQEGR